MTGVRALESAQPRAREVSGTALRTEAVAPLRAEVVDSIGHVLGNLFQRLNHLADRSAEADAMLGEEIRGAVDRLDAFMRIVLDYLSPRTLQPIAVAASTAVEALGQRLRQSLGGRARIDLDCSSSAQLAVDPGLLAIGFDSLIKSLSPGRQADGAPRVRVAARDEVGQVVIAVFFSKGMVSLSAEADVYRALAERVIELHRGSAHLRRSAAGEVVWEITLPCRS